MSALASTFKTIDDEDSIMSPTSQHFFHSLKSEPPQQPALDYIVGNFLDSLETLPSAQMVHEPLSYREDMLMLPSLSHKRSYSESVPALSLPVERRYSLQPDAMVLPSPDQSPLVYNHNSAIPEIAYVVPSYPQYGSSNSYLDVVPKFEPIEQTIEIPGSSYNCTVAGCSKRFSKYSSLQSHLLTHNSGKPKPFSCTQCPQSFSRSHGNLRLTLDLKRHMYIHSQDKPFVCTRCNRGFSRRDALKRHEKSVAEGKKVHCNPPEIKSE